MPLCAKLLCCSNSEIPAGWSQILITSISIHSVNVGRDRVGHPMTFYNYLMVYLKGISVRGPARGRKVTHLCTITVYAATVEKALAVLWIESDLMTSLGHHPCGQTTAALCKVQCSCIGLIAKAYASPPPGLWSRQSPKTKISSAGMIILLAPLLSLSWISLYLEASYSIMREYWCTPAMLEHSSNFVSALLWKAWKFKNYF